MGSVGSLADLDTTDKSTIVNAINEVLGNQGDLADLETTATSDLVSAINEVNAETDVIDKLNAVIVETPTFSSLPQTFTDAQLTFEQGDHITTDLICNKYDFELSDPTAGTGTWTVDTDTEGQITIRGTISGSTSMKIWLRHFEVSPPASGVTASWVGMHSIIKVTISGITSLPVTVSGMTGVTAQHELAVEGWGLVTPSSSMGNDWTVTCNDDSVTISGTFSGSTSTKAEFTIGIPDNKLTKTA